MIEFLGRESVECHPAHELRSGLTCKSFVFQKLSEEFRHSTMNPED